MASAGRETQVEKLALGVARGLSMRQAAKEAGVPDTTARRLAAEPTFAPRVDALRRSMLARATGRLASVAVKAAAKLSRLIDSKDEATALRAARAVLADMINIQSHYELAERLTELEKRAEAVKPPSWHHH